MMINKVHLQNYRNHIDSEFKFTSGINLIYGLNGSGKTSILEAIGLVLFGAQTRTNNKDAVRENEKTASVSVEFSTNDGGKYLIEKQLPSGKVKLTDLNTNIKKNVTDSELKDLQKSLIGINANSGNMYSDFIVGSQNKITDIFTGTPKEKRERFDKLFDTEIYRQIADKYLKDSEDIYKLDLIKKEEYLFNKRSQLFDDEELNNSKSILEKEQKESEIKYNSINSEIESNNIKINELTEISNKISRVNLEINHLNERQAEFTKSIKNLHEELNNSNNALITVSETYENYKEYESKLLEINRINDAIHYFESLDDSTKSLKNRLSELEMDIAITNLDLKNELKKYDEIKASMDTNNLLIKQYDDDLLKLIEMKDSVQRMLSELKFASNKPIEIQNRVSAISSEIAEKNVELGSISSLLVNEEELTDELNETKILINDLAELDKKLSKEKILLSNLYQRLNDNIEAREKLSGGICPFLAEKCKNIEDDDSSSSNFFETKAQLLQTEIDSKILYINELEIKVSKYDQYKGQYQILLEKLNNNSANLTRVHDIKNSISLIEQTKINAELTYQIEAEVIMNKLSLTRVEDKIDYIKNLNDLINNSTIEINNHESNIRLTEKQKNQYMTEKDNLNQQLNNLQKLISEKTNSLKILNSERVDVESKISENTDKLKDFEDTKLRRNKINNEMSLFKSNHDKYLQNIELANRKQMIENEIYDLNELFNLNKSKLLESKSLMDNLISKFDKDEILRLENLTGELSAIKDMHLSKIQEFKTKLDFLNDKIRQNQIFRTEISEYEKLCKILNKKMELTKTLKANLRNMGQIIANKILGKIENLASKNYQFISGRDETIKWNSDLESNNSYQVYLKLKSGKTREFELLSGGEQMMVAISLRAAMNALLTNARFVIFDEPTVNLDGEKRAALSESLNYLLNSLEQAIIVTHDETFREMASNFIQLS